MGVCLSSVKSTINRVYNSTVYVKCAPPNEDGSGRAMKVFKR